MRPPDEEERDDPLEEREDEPELRDGPLEDREDPLERDGELTLRDGELDPVEPELCRDRRADPEEPCGDRDGELRLREGVLEEYERDGELKLRDGELAEREGELRLREGVLDPVEPELCRDRRADPEEACGERAAALERDGELATLGVRMDEEEEEPDPEGVLRIREEEEEVLPLLREVDADDRDGKSAVPAEGERSVRGAAAEPVEGVRIAPLVEVEERSAPVRTGGLERIVCDSVDREEFSRMVRAGVPVSRDRRVSGVRTVASPGRFTVPDDPRSRL